jgi:peptide/nickel transport system permease protein
VIAPETTYWDIVKTQYAKNRVAVWALRLLAGLFVLAIIAPVLCTSTPFYVTVAEKSPYAGVSTFPWFAALFDQNRFPSGVDLFFNLLLVFLIPGVVLWKLTKGKVRRRVFAVLAVIFVVAFLQIVIPGRWFHYSKPKIDYLELRGPHLDTVLAEEKIEMFQANLTGAVAALEVADATLGKADLAEDERSETEADRMASADRKATAELGLKKWRGKLEAAQKKAKDKDLAYTILLPPVGYHHDDNDEDRVVDPPTFRGGWGTWHILGTDRNGRDVLARILYGTRVSLTIGVVAVSIYCTIGAILGALMGFFGGWVDILLMRLVEIMICFPAFMFILILVAVTGTNSIFMIMFAIGMIGWTGAARLIRGQFLSERNLDYVVAAQALGIPKRRIAFKHILPNAIHPIFVTATFGVAAAILLESGLAFLGLGDPNVPSWGQILLQGRETKEIWLIHSPGFAIFFTVTILNVVGEGLRDALDPKLRQ